MTERKGTGAILLAGGRATRLGGIDKPLLEIDGRSLLQRALDAVAGCEPVVVAGPARSDVAGAVTWVREDPPFTGPAAAIVAALAALPEQPARPDAPGPAWTLVLACNLADPAAAVAALTGARAAASADLDGWCLGDRDGRAQWLTALYRTAALRRAAAALPDAGTHASVRTLVGPLRLELIAAGPATDDIDTWHDAERAGARPRPVPTALLTPTKETP
ncbi:molybdenum cofactor guanylyltransferase [Microbacterium aurum]